MKYLKICWGTFCAFVWSSYPCIKVEWLGISSHHHFLLLVLYPPVYHVVYSTVSLCMYHNCSFQNQKKHVLITVSHYYTFRPLIRVRQILGPDAQDKLKTICWTLIVFYFQKKPTGLLCNK
mgnify:CR=1 FL=1